MTTTTGARIVVLKQEVRPSTRKNDASFRYQRRVNKSSKECLQWQQSADGTTHGHSVLRLMATSAKLKTCLCFERSKCLFCYEGGHPLLAIYSALVKYQWCWARGTYFAKSVLTLPSSLMVEHLASVRSQLPVSNETPSLENPFFGSDLSFYVSMSKWSAEPFPESQKEELMYDRMDNFADFTGNSAFTPHKCRYFTPPTTRCLFAFLESSGRSPRKR